QKLFEAIDQHDKVRSNEFTELEERYIYLERFKGVKYTPVPKLILPILSDEEHQILKSPLLSSGNSHLSKFIEKLSNSDWVRNGVRYLSEEQCPFCQQYLDSERLKEELESIFDETYNENLAQIEALKERYAVWKSNIDNYLVNFEGLTAIIDESLLAKNISDIRNHYDSNERLIVKKLSSPSISVGLISDIDVADNLNKQVNHINEQIAAHNKKIDNYVDERGILTQDLLAHLKFINEASLNRYHEQEKELDDLIDRLNDEVKTINSQNAKLQEENRLKASEVVNIEDTINKINDSLVSLGITGFTLIKHQDESETYKLYREGQSNAKSVFKSLSEGEKTIISFLYFIEQCKGLKNKNDIIKDKFIVIDDPISSLSHNYIYEISSMIFNDLILKEIAKK
ncbi:TPA: AAA family ATPase, partial [Enterobacter bugandensis]|nr:AAA family ATPase [Enterobacter bugandensis]